MAIVRIWKGVVRRTDEAAYLEYVRTTGLNDYRATDGNLGAWFMKRDVDEGVEMSTLTLWESVEAIKRFAGEDYNMARYYPMDDRFLLSKAPFVDHYELVEASMIENWSAHLRP